MFVKNSIQNLIKYGEIHEHFLLILICVMIAVIIMDMTMVMDMTAVMRQNDTLELLIFHIKIMKILLNLYHKDSF